MGEQNSKVDTQKQPNHPKFGKIRIFHQVDKHLQENIMFMELSIPIATSKQVHQWQEESRLLRARNCNTESLFLPHQYQMNQTGMCGSSGILKLVYQYYPFLLNNEIQNRSNIRQPFLEKQMWYVLYILISGVAQFQSDNMKIADLRPKNILISSQGQIKMLNKFTMPNQAPGMAKAGHSDQICFLGKIPLSAPQQIEAIKQPSLSHEIVNSTADAFSIGLTLLQAATFNNAQTIYDGMNSKIKRNKLDEFIDELRQKDNLYSPFLIQTIQSMVDLDPINRPTCGQIQSILLPYEDDIMNLTQFIPNQQMSDQSFRQYQKKVKKYKHLANKYQDQYSPSKENTKFPSFSQPQVHQQKFDNKRFQPHPIPILRQQSSTIIKQPLRQQSQPINNIPLQSNYNRSQQYAHYTNMNNPDIRNTYINNPNISNPNVISSNISNTNISSNPNINNPNINFSNNLSANNANTNSRNSFYKTPSNTINTQMAISNLSIPNITNITNPNTTNLNNNYTISANSYLKPIKQQQNINVPPVQNQQISYHRDFKTVQNLQPLSPIPPYNQPTYTPMTQNNIPTIGVQLPQQNIRNTTMKYDIKNVPLVNSMVGTKQTQNNYMPRQTDNWKRIEDYRGIANDQSNNYQFKSNQNPVNIHNKFLNLKVQQQLKSSQQLLRRY